MPTLYTQPAFWFTMVLTIALALFPRFVGKATHALQELTPAKRVLREIAANNRRAQSRLRNSLRENSCRAAHQCHRQYAWASVAT